MGFGDRLVEPDRNTCSFGLPVCEFCWARPKNEVPLLQNLEQLVQSFFIGVHHSSNKFMFALSRVLPVLKPSTDPVLPALGYEKTRASETLFHYLADSRLNRCRFISHGHLKELLGFLLVLRVLKGEFIESAVGPCPYEFHVIDQALSQECFDLFLLSPWNGHVRHALENKQLSFPMLELLQQLVNVLYCTRFQVSRVFQVSLQ